MRTLPSLLHFLTLFCPPPLRLLILSPPPPHSVLSFYFAPHGVVCTEREL